MTNKEIELEVLKNGFCVIPNFISKISAIDIRNQYFKILKTSILHSQSEKFNFEDLEKLPWRKTAVGSSNGLGSKISQVLQTTYIGETFFKKESNIFNIIKKIVALRNNLTNMDPEFGCTPKQDRYWNAIRFHHYPSGGGHMAQHYDSHFPKILARSNISFIQLSISLSNKGEHFEEGGGFIINKLGKKIYLENQNSLGSLIIFDGSMEHGVDDVDKGLVLDWSSQSGRISLFSNLYEVLN